MCHVKGVRLLVLLVYVGYLVHVGLLLLLLPWTDAWAALILRLPLHLAIVFDNPAVRGAISAFGGLHLLLLLAELLMPRPWRLP